MLQNKTLLTTTVLPLRELFNSIQEPQLVMFKL